MLGILSRNWWIFAIRGVAAILFGISAAIWPALTITVLALFLAAYLLVDGISMLIALVRGDPVARRNAWSVAIIGVLGVAAGVIAFFYPNVTAVALLYVVAFWSIAIGVFQVIAAISLRREIEGELWLAIGGIVAIVFGVYLAVFPGSGLVSLGFLVAIYAIAFGVSSLLLAFKLRNVGTQRIEPSPA
jgi:uncharacterized membrane protein HdeD (DUF308 family)